MTEPAELAANAERSASDVVRDFLNALAGGDVDLALSLVAEDLVYENVSLPTIRGKGRFTKGLHDFTKRGLSFGVRIHRITEDGSTVMTERTDGLGFRRFALTVEQQGDLVGEDLEPLEQGVDPLAGLRRHRDDDAVDERHDPVGQQLVRPTQQRHAMQGLRPAFGPVVEDPEHVRLAGF